MRSFECAADACSLNVDSINNTSAIGCCECVYWDELAREWAESQNEEEKD